MNLENLDFVYLLGKGSRWQDNELRYSMRSLEQNVPHRRIIVAGERPDWLSEKVLHLPCVDEYPNKLQNATQKIRIVCQTFGISEDFVLMNDDFFIMKPIDAIGSFTDRELKDLIREHETQGGYYFAALRTTDYLLQEAGIDTRKNFELHVPMVVNREKFLDITNTIEWRRTPYLFRSVYGNVLGLSSKQKKDVKIYRGKSSVSWDNMTMLSIDTTTALSETFQRWIDSKFPQRSKYEK